MYAEERRRRTGAHRVAGRHGSCPHAGLGCSPAAGRTRPGPTRSGRTIRMEQQGPDPMTDLGHEDLGHGRLKAEGETPPPSRRAAISQLLPAMPETRKDSVDDERRCDRFPPGRLAGSRRAVLRRAQRQEQRDPDHHRHRPDGDPTADLLVGEVGAEWQCDHETQRGERLHDQ